MGNGKLTVKMVRAINRPGMYGDGNTLYLNVAPGGSKQWIQRLTINGCTSSEPFGHKGPGFKRVPGSSGFLQATLC